MKIFELFGSVFVDTEDANKSLHKVESTGESTFKKLGSGIKTLAKVGVAGATAFAGGVAALTTKAVQNYAEYEQLVGGVDTLFKESNKKVLEYANNAYKTAGMSANTYMETVTSFSASLLQSLNNDTKKSAEIADMAITDMSDNANKMGTDMQRIQDAYQGFAKQNYTMLDNLKLGYGGTKTEMERLLADAEKLSGIKYNIDNLSDVYNAIHVIQEEMGITGTTAKEAGSTIQGSFAMMKASWENLMTGMADPSQDIGLLIGNMVDSGVTFLNNLVPRIVETIPRVVAGIGQVGSAIGKSIPTIMTKLVPVLVDGGVSLMNALVEGFGKLNLGKMTEKATQFMSSFGTLLKDNIPTVAAKAIDMIDGFVDKVAENLPTILSSGLELLHNFVQGIMNALPTLIERVPTIVSKIANLINDNMPLILAKGFDIVVTIGKGLIKAIPTLVVNIPKIIKAIVDVFTAFQWLNLGKNAIAGIKNGFLNMKNSLTSTAKNVMNGVKDAMLHPINIAKTSFTKIIDKIKGLFNFKIKFPKVPMPHFKITPTGWAIGDLLKGKIPRLGVEYYAKGGILTDPTAFGISPSGNIRVGGEAGDEAVAPIDLLLGYVRTAVNESNNLMAERLQNLILMLSEYLPQFANTQIVLDSGVLVGELSTGIDIELGNIQRRKGR